MKTEPGLEKLVDTRVLFNQNESRSETRALFNQNESRSDTRALFNQNESRSQSFSSGLQSPCLKRYRVHHEGTCTRRSALSVLGILNCCFLVMCLHRIVHICTFYLIELFFADAYRESSPQRKLYVSSVHNYTFCLYDAISAHCEFF